MQKTILAVALASAFSMGAACAADTNVTILQGQGAQPLLKRASEILCPWDNRSPPNGCIQ